MNQEALVISKGVPQIQGTKNKLQKEKSQDHVTIPQATKSNVIFP